MARFLVQGAPARDEEAGEYRGDARELLINKETKGTSKFSQNHNAKRLSFR